MSIAIFGFFAYLYTKAERAHAEDFLATDINQSGIVTQEDADIIANNFTDSPKARRHDVNEDGKVDSADLALVEDDMGNGTDPNRDWDKDGYTVSQGDCQDRDKNINPIAEEKADQVDNNCNSSIDEFVNYKPLTSDTVYQITVHFHKTSSDPALSVASVVSKKYSQPYASQLSAGTYVVVLRNQQGSLLDVAPFGSCLEGETLSVGGGSNYSKDDCDIIVTVPNTSEVKKVEIKSLKNDSFSLPVDLSLVGNNPHFSTALADEPTAECQGEWKKYSNNCYNFHLFPKEFSDKALASFESIVDNMPILTIVPEETIQLINEGNGCDGQRTALACQSAGGVMTIIVENMEYRPKAEFEIVIAHELSHYIYFLFRDYPNISPGHDYNDLFLNKIASLYRKIDIETCAGDATKCILKPDELVSAWSAYANPLELKGVVYGKAPLEWQDRANPLTHADDPFGPRPGVGLGVSRIYGETYQFERWATIFEALYLDAIHQTRLDFLSYPELPDLHFYVESLKYFVKEYPDFSEIVQGTSILGQHGLIKDWDHDGVPDDYDNCSPEKVTICADDTEKCKNPDQQDKAPKDGIGDMCEQNLYVGYCTTMPGKCLDDGKPKLDANGNPVCPDMKQAIVNKSDPCAGYYGVYGASTTSTGKCTKLPPEPEPDLGGCAVGSHVKQLAGVCGEEHGTETFRSGVCFFSSSGESWGTPEDGCKVNEDCFRVINGWEIRPSCAPEVGCFHKFY